MLATLELLKGVGLGGGGGCHVGPHSNIWNSKNKCVFKKEAKSRFASVVLIGVLGSLLSASHLVSL